MKRNCKIKLEKDNDVESKVSTEDEQWTKCFMTQVTSTSTLATRSLEIEWIIDSSCGLHITEDEEQVSHIRHHEEKDIIVNADNTLYYVHVLLTSSFYVEKTSNNDNAYLWHSILDHVNMAKLKLMVQKELVKRPSKVDY